MTVIESSKRIHSRTALAIGMLCVLSLCVFVGCGKAPAFKDMTLSYPNGAIRERWQEDSWGFKQGTAYTYYVGGGKQTQATFLNGYLHGSWVMWDTVGNELARGEYRHGEPWSGTFVSTNDQTRQIVFRKYQNGALAP